MLFSAPGIGEQISGVILFDETIRQPSSDGVPFPRLLEARGAVPGIRVDLGAKPLVRAHDELVTEGLDGLHERLAAYRQLDLVLETWRGDEAKVAEAQEVFAERARVNGLARQGRLDGASRDRGRRRGSQGLHEHHSQQFANPARRNPVTM